MGGREDDDTQPEVVDEGMDEISIGFGSDEVVFQREHLTWIWMPPTEQTLREVVRRRGHCRDKIDIELFAGNLPGSRLAVENSEAPFQGLGLL